MPTIFTEFYSQLRISRMLEDNFSDSLAYTVSSLLSLSLQERQKDNVK